MPKSDFFQIIQSALLKGRFPYTYAAYSQKARDSQPLSNCHMHVYLSLKLNIITYIYPTDELPKDTGSQILSSLYKVNLASTQINKPHQVTSLCTTLC